MAKLFAILVALFVTMTPLIAFAVDGGGGW